MTGTDAPTTSATAAARTYPDYGRPLWQRWLLTRESAVIAALVVVAVVAAAVVPNFGTPITLGFLLLDVTPILLIALPMTLVIVSGEIDLSVASTLGLSSVLLGVLTKLKAVEVPVAQIGRTGGSTLIIAGEGEVAVEDLNAAFERWLPDFMAAR